MEGFGLRPVRRGSTALSNTAPTKPLIVECKFAMNDLIVGARGALSLPMVGAASAQAARVKQQTQPIVMMVPSQHSSNRMAGCLTRLRGDQVVLGSQSTARVMPVSRERVPTAASG